MRQFIIRIILALFTLWLVIVAIGVLGGLAMQGTLLLGLLLGAALIALIIAGRSKGVRQKDATEEKQVADTFR